MPELPDAANAGRLVFDFEDPPETSWTADPPLQSSGSWRRFAGDLFLTYSGSAGDSLRLELTAQGGPTREVTVAAVSFLDPWDGRVNEQGNNGRYRARYGSQGLIGEVIYISA